MRINSQVEQTLRLIGDPLLGRFIGISEIMKPTAGGARRSMARDHPHVCGAVYRRPRDPQKMNVPRSVAVRISTAPSLLRSAV